MFCNIAHYTQKAMLKKAQKASVTRPVRPRFPHEV